MAEHYIPRWTGSTAAKDFRSENIVFRPRSDGSREIGVMTEVSEEVYRDQTRSNNAFRVRQMRHGACRCPLSMAWTCDTDCLGGCLFHATPDGEVALNACAEDEETPHGEIPAPGCSPEEIVVDQDYFSRVTQALVEDFPRGAEMLELWRQDPDISWREMARRLGVPPATLSYQLRQFREKTKEN